MDQRSKAMLAIGAMLLAVVIALGAVIATRRDTTADQPLAAAPPRPPAKVDVAPIDAPVDAGPASSAELLRGIGLPAAGIDAKKIIGHARADVDRVLAGAFHLSTGETEAYIDGVKIAVVFDGDRAVGIEVPDGHPAPELMKDEQLAALRAWFHYEKGDKPAGREIALYACLDTRSGVAIYEDGYVDKRDKLAAEQKAQQDRVEEARAERQKMRGDIVVGLRRMIRALDGDFEISSDDEREILTFETPPSDESCDRPTLVKMAETMRGFDLDPAKCFRSWRCSNGTELKFR